MHIGRPARARALGGIAMKCNVSGVFVGASSFRPISAISEFSASTLSPPNPPASA